jgi:PadR family transcriptional regulator
MRAESLKGHLDALVLAVLRDEPAHGYAVIEQLKRRSDGAFDLPEGTVYPVLHRLEAEGLLSSSWSTASGRKRRVYKLTRRGQNAFARQRDEWKSFANAVQAVLA